MNIEQVIVAASRLIILPETAGRVAGVVEAASAERLAAAVAALWGERGCYSWWSGRAWIPGRRGDLLRLQGRRCETRVCGIGAVEIRPDIRARLGRGVRVVEEAFTAAVCGRAYRHELSPAFFAPATEGVAS